jgi:histidine phosphotransfer protein HptB
MTDTINEIELLFSTLGGDPELATLVEMFVDELPRRVQAMRDCLQAADLDGLQRAAHQLKGAAGSYGFHEITDEAAHLERAVRERRGDQDIAAAVESLAAICSRARAGTPRR